MIDSATLSVYPSLLLAYVVKFFSDIRVAIIVGLILLDVALAVAAAVKSKTFEGRRLAEYLRTMVVPYILGYLALYLFSKLMAWSAAQTNADLSVWLGQAAVIVSEGVIMGAWLTLVYNLGADIVRHLKALRYPFADGMGITPGVTDEANAGGPAHGSGEGVDANATKPPGYSQ